MDLLNKCVKQFSIKEDTFGVNYEGGNIIRHILKFPECLAYANIQIVQDAPYEPTFNIEYDENKIINTIREILTYIKKTYINVRIVIQLAIIKNITETYTRIFKPILKELDLLNSTVSIKQGYTTEMYYIPDYDKRPFIFINYGLFSLLNNCDKIKAGTIYNPIYSYPIVDYDNIGFIYSSCPYVFKNEKNILNMFPNIKTMSIFSLKDNLPLFTDKNYKKEHVLTLFKNVKLIQ